MTTTEPEQAGAADDPAAGSGNVPPQKSSQDFVRAAAEGLFLAGAGEREPSRAGKKRDNTARTPRRKPTPAELKRSLWSSKANPLPDPITPEMLAAVARDLRLVGDKGRDKLLPIVPPEPSSDKPEAPAAKDPAAEPAAPAPPAVQSAIAELPVAKDPAAELSVAQPPSVEKPVEGVPAAETSAREEPAAEKPAVETAAVEPPVVQSPAAEPTAEKPVMESPVVQPPPAEKPIAEVPVAETPILNEPAAEQPVAEAVVVEPSVEQLPAAELTAVKEPAAEIPVVQPPPVEKPLAETPVMEAPAAEPPPAKVPTSDLADAPGVAPARKVTRLLGGGGHRETILLDLHAPERPDESVDEHAVEEKPAEAGWDVARYQRLGLAMAAALFVVFVLCDIYFKANANWMRTLLKILPLIFGMALAAWGLWSKSVAIKIAAAVLIGLFLLHAVDRRPLQHLLPSWLARSGEVRKAEAIRP